MEIINILSYAILTPCITLFIYTVIGSPKVFDNVVYDNEKPYVEITDSMLLSFFGKFIAKMYIKFRKNPFNVFLCPYCLNFWVALLVATFASYNNHISYISIVAIIALSQQLVKHAK